jgi:hypothetical protein
MKWWLIVPFVLWFSFPKTITIITFLTLIALS